MFFFLHQPQKLSSTARIWILMSLQSITVCSVHPKSDFWGYCPELNGSYGLVLVRSITCLSFLFQLGFTPPEKNSGERWWWPPVEDVGLPWWQHPPHRGRAHGLALRMLLQAQVSARAPQLALLLHSLPALLPLCSRSALPAEFPNAQIKPSSAFHSVDLRLIAFSILYIFNAVPVAVHVTRSNKLFRYCCIHFLPVHALRQTQSRY